MTFKDLQKLVQSQSGREQNQLPQKLKDKPFWIWDKEHKAEHARTKRDCCFNHIIGLPKKDGHDMPLLPYQRTLHDPLQNHNISVKCHKKAYLFQIILITVDQ
jgi:hypothetical protein